MTALVATTIQSLFPLSNIRPIDIRRYFASSILSNRMTLPEENVNGTLQAWANICNTSVEMARNFCNGPIGTVRGTEQSERASKLANRDALCLLIKESVL